ncbi:hypothetical protein [Nonomuraea sp. NPDC049141]
MATDVLNAEELITHRFPLAEVDQAIAAIQDRREPIWMAVVIP